MNFKSINLGIKEGQLLFAALVILTQSEGLVINGQAVDGTRQTPDDILKHLENVAHKNRGSFREIRLGFASELASLLNKYSMENGSNTPDFVLAQYLENCLKVFDTAVAGRETWACNPALHRQTMKVSFDVAEETLRPETKEALAELNQRTFNNYPDEKPGTNTFLNPQNNANAAD